jgi:hypothetical protein
VEPILVEAAWQDAKASGSFRVQNPGTKADLGVEFPLSSWADCDRILDAAVAAARVLRGTSGEVIAAFLEGYASRIEARADEIVQTAHNETALPGADAEELKQALTSLEGNLTAAIYSSKAGADDALYPAVAEILRSRCGRLLNDRMPTGVALSPAMNHGGPFPAQDIPVSPRSAFCAPCNDSAPCNATTAFVTIACPWLCWTKLPTNTCGAWSMAHG